MDIKLFSLIIVQVCMMVAGQSLWKVGLSQIGGITGFDKILMCLYSIPIVSGLVIYVVATLSWFYILSIGDFSKVYPMGSLAYILGVLVAYFIFKEQVPLTRWIGVAIVLVGVFLIALEPSKIQ